MFTYFQYRNDNGFQLEVSVSQPSSRQQYFRFRFREMFLICELLVFFKKIVILLSLLLCTFILCQYHNSNYLPHG